MTWQQDDADHIYIIGCSGSKGDFRMKGADNGKGISAWAVGLHSIDKGSDNFNCFAKCYNNQFPPKCGPTIMNLANGA